MPNEKQDSSELTNSVALLVVDAQDAFISSLAESDAFLQRCSFAIDAARTLGILTLFTEQVPDKLGHTHKGLLQRASNPKVFHKTKFSALSAPGIEGFLRDNEIYHVLVCGLETPICVYQTALQAVDEDIDVTFLADALGCRRIEDANMALNAIRELGCQVLPSETVFYSLLGGADHPCFKDFTSLVKAFSEPRFSISEHLETPPKFDKAAENKDQPRKSKNRRNRSSRQERSHNKTISNTSSDQSAAQKKPESKSPEKEQRPRHRPDPKRKGEGSPEPKGSEDKPKKQAKKAPRKRVARKAPKKSASNRPRPSNEKTS